MLIKHVKAMITTIFLHNSRSQSCTTEATFIPNTRQYTLSRETHPHNTFNLTHNTTTTTVLRPFVRDYPGEPVPEETLTHPPF